MNPIHLASIHAARARGVRNFTTARKSGSRLAVTFKVPRGAARTEVVVTGKNGTRLAQLAMGKDHKLIFDNVKWETKFKVTARGVGDDGRAGPATRLRLRVRP